MASTIQTLTRILVAALYCSNNRQVQRAPLVRKTGNLATPRKDPARKAAAPAAAHPAPRTKIRAKTKVIGSVPTLEVTKSPENMLF